jgi:hypothetical protein
MQASSGHSQRDVLRMPIPSRSDVLFALSGVPVFAIAWVYADPGVRALLGPSFDFVIWAHHTAALAQWQVRLSMTGLYLGGFVLCSMAAIPPLSVLGLLFPKARPRSAAIVVAILVAVLLIGTRARYMFTMPYVGWLGGAVFVSALAGLALFTAGMISSRLGALIRSIT